MGGDELLTAASTALAEGRWAEARAAFEQVVAEDDRPDAWFGLATALWWFGDSQASVDAAAHAYAGFRKTGDDAGAIQAAVWLCITYKANFGNTAAANGWIGRAERLLETVEPGPPGVLHGWAWISRAYRMSDLDTAERLTQQAVDVARAANDIDLELVALSQLGLIRTGQGHVTDGFALLDEASAAALAGEGANIDTVVYACCDMLNACELVNDVERAVQWCQVADGFVDRYGCPFLYAECRIYYGSVLSAKGRWDDAERELRAGLRITEGASPGLFARAQIRLAALRIRQGRLEEAAALLSDVDHAVTEQAEANLSLAALMLARGDAPSASRSLQRRLAALSTHLSHLATALDLLVEACLASGDVDGATAASARLTELSESDPSGRVAALTATARARLAVAAGDLDTAATQLETALALWAMLDLPFEVARARLDLAGVIAGRDPEAAVSHGRRALESLEALGAALDADRAAALLRSLGVAARVGPKGVGLLTQREQEVLRLLGAGLSNPEIAQRLHVSRKTASHHVSHVLTKLNLRNRAEAAAFATGQKMGQLPDA